MEKFRDGDGRLTEYALACGYTENKTTDDLCGLETQLFMRHDHYHVRQCDWRPEATIFRVFWEVFGSLSEARALFDEQPGEQ